MEYPVLCGEEEMGIVTITEQGAKTQIEVSCRRSNAGLYRGYLLCRRGEYPLGVLEPWGERMTLRRTILTGDLREMGTIWRGEIRMSYAFHSSSDWQRISPVSSFFQRSEYLGRSAEELPGGFWRKEETCRQLALPYDPGRPFPLPELFCFAQVMTREGETYVVYTFDREERPLLPKKTVKKGWGN